MSSTSQQIDDAKKIAARVEKGEQVTPITNTSNASAEQLSHVVPQQPDIEIDKNAVVGGLNRVNMQPVGQKEATAVVVDREIAPVVGTEVKLNLAEQFKDPLIRAEEKTAIPDDQKTSAEVHTQLTEQQKDAKPSDEEVDKTTAAKQTKVHKKDEKKTKKHVEKKDTETAKIKVVVKEEK